VVRCPAADSRRLRRGRRRPRPCAPGCRRSPPRGIRGLAGAGVQAHLRIAPRAGSWYPRAPPRGVVHLPGSAVGLPWRAAGLPASAAGPPQSAAYPPASAAGPPQSAAYPPASAAYPPGSALRQPTIAPSCVSCPYRVRRAVRGPGPATTCVFPGAHRRRLTSARLAATPRPPRPGTLRPGTLRASPEPLRASPCGAGLRQLPPHGLSPCPVPRREEPASPGRGRQAHRTAAGCSLKYSTSYGRRRQSGPSSGCARPPGRRWSFPLAASRVLQPRRPTSSICHNTVPYSIISRTQTSEEGRSTSSGATLFKHVRRRPTLPRGPPRSTIGAEGLNFRVRNGTGCFPFAITAETLLRCHRPAWRRACLATVSREPHSGREIKWSRSQATRPISTGQLHTLPCFHLRPINPVV
jgi:hypothetical protein